MEGLAIFAVYVARGARTRIAGKNCVKRLNVGVTSYSVRIVWYIVFIVRGTYVRNAGLAFAKLHVTSKDKDSV